MWEKEQGDNEEEYWETHFKRCYKLLIGMGAYAGVPYLNVVCLLHYMLHHRSSVMQDLPDTLRYFECFHVCLVWHVSPAGCSPQASIRTFCWAQLLARPILPQPLLLLHCFREKTSYRPNTTWQGYLPFCIRQSGVYSLLLCVGLFVAKVFLR